MHKLISFEEHSIDVAKKAVAKILKYTPQIFVINKEKKTKNIQPYCSGVLFKTKTSHYFATAHHCIYQNGERIKIVFHSSNRRLYALMDPVTYASDGDKEKIDIALMKLTERSVKVLSEDHLFLDYSDIRKASLLDFQSEFIIVGYNQTGTKFDHPKKVMLPKPFVQVTHSAKSEVYEKLKYDKGLHTLLDYNRRKSTIIGSGVMSMAPIPNGISGCGFWLVKDYFVLPDDVEVQLAGIMYLHLDNKQLMVGGNSDLLNILLKKSELRFGI